MDAGRRYETPGSETKILITQSTAGSMNFLFVLVPLVVISYMGDTDGPRWMLPMPEFGVTAE